MLLLAEISDMAESPPAAAWAAALGCAMREKWNCGRAAICGLPTLCGDGVCGESMPVDAIANASGESWNGDDDKAEGDAEIASTTSSESGENETAARGGWWWWWWWCAECISAL